LEGQILRSHCGRKPKANERTAGREGKRAAKATGQLIFLSVELSYFLFSPLN
jgi:hypothetical protein